MDPFSLRYSIARSLNSLLPTILSCIENHAHAITRYLYRQWRRPSTIPKIDGDECRVGAERSTAAGPPSNLNGFSAARPPLSATTGCIVTR
jgi:hypothetical protein